MVTYQKPKTVAEAFADYTVAYDAYQMAKRLMSSAESQLRNMEYMLTLAHLAENGRKPPHLVVSNE